MWNNKLWVHKYLQSYFTALIYVQILCMYIVTFASLKIDIWNYYLLSYSGINLLNYWNTFHENIYIKWVYKRNLGSLRLFWKTCKWAESHSLLPGIPRIQYCVKMAWQKELRSSVRYLRANLLSLYVAWTKQMDMFNTKEDVYQPEKLVPKDT